MGGSNSKHSISSNELSDDESDSEYFQPREMEVYRSDAVLRNSSAPIGRVLSLNNIQPIQDELDEYEIVSLVFLLYDRAEIALQYLHNFLINSKSTILYDWANSEEKLGRNWTNKFIEALCIVQNYKVLRGLGFDKEELRVHYIPCLADTSVTVNKFRKALYLLAEKLDFSETNEFLNNVKKTYPKIPIPLTSTEYTYLELYFLTWEQNKIDIYKYIKSALKLMDKEELADPLLHCLSQVTPVENNGQVTVALYSKKTEFSERLPRTTRDTTYHVSNEDNFSIGQMSGSSLVTSTSSDDNRYSIDPANPGKVLIINQEEFYTEPDHQYEALLPKDHEKQQLVTRLGTEKDKKKLMAVFRKYGFTIIAKDNLPHYKVTSVIQEEAKNITKESSFIVCILSHGENGIIYGANSCKIYVDSIEDAMKKDSPNLIGRPKILILQSCQGQNCQRRDEHDKQYVTDGPNSFPSKSADFLTFFATIPGYAAIRNIYHGSWFIQTICEEIERMASRYHLLDICTRVQNIISTKEWREKNGVNIMTPVMQSTLRKSFFLPPVKN